MSGAASSNTRQYAGMPNDGTGLAYDQARYYDPSLQRFISPDPLGFGGGSLNLYSYVNNSPTNATDPSGTGPIAQCVVGGSLNAALGWGMSAFSGRKYTWRQGLGDFATGCVLRAINPVDLAEDWTSLAASDADESVPATAHGLERLTERGITGADYQAAKQYGTVLTQADGATVYVHEVEPGRFNVIVEGERGVITGFKRLGQGALDRLAKNYGWSPR